MFLAEGVKTVTELLDSDIEVHSLYTLDANIVEGYSTVSQVISPNELKKLSGQKTPNKVLGVFHIPQSRAVDFTDWIVVLDGVQDPGNLGTIIRLCDWFGMSHLVCSKDTVDCYNPKVLQATMGSIARVNLVYTDIEEFLGQQSVPVFGTFMDGDAIYDENLPEKGILLLGNEGNGISGKMMGLVSRKVGIPQFGKDTAESLNVAMATAIFLNEIRRGGYTTQR